MLYVLSKVNKMSVSLMTAHNRGRTSNFHEHSGPHECEYHVSYWLPDKDDKPHGSRIVTYDSHVFYEHLSFTVYHDRLDGHTRLIERCMRMISEKLEAEEYEE